MRKSIGIILLILGAVSVGVSYYIDAQVSQGKREIAEGQQQIDTFDTLTSVDPVTKDLDKDLTASSRQRLREGREDVAWYNTLAGWFKIGGWCAVALGVIIALLPKRK